MMDVLKHQQNDSDILEHELLTSISQDNRSKDKTSRTRCALLDYQGDDIGGLEGKKGWAEQHRIFVEAWLQ